MSKAPEDTHVMVELKEVLASLIFASNRAVNINEMRKCIAEVAEKHGKEAAVFAEIKPSDIKKALGDLQKDVAAAKCGFIVQEVHGGFRFQSDHRCGPWLKVFLNRSKPNRLSRPGLETMAIIAYRQPITRAEIERIRGVGIDHVMKALLEAQLIRIVGRSELPGRPFLYGTTQLFLEHFGLKDLEGLKDRDILSNSELGKASQRISSGHDDKDARESLHVEKKEVAVATVADATTDAEAPAEDKADSSEDEPAASEDDGQSEADAQEDDFEAAVESDDTASEHPDSGTDLDVVVDETDDDGDEDEFDDDDEDED